MARVSKVEDEMLETLCPRYVYTFLMFIVRIEMVMGEEPVKQNTRRPQDQSEAWDFRNTVSMPGQSVAAGE